MYPEFRSGVRHSKLKMTTCRSKETLKTMKLDIAVLKKPSPIWVRNAMRLEKIVKSQKKSRVDEDLLALVCEKW